MHDNVDGMRCSPHRSAKRTLVCAAALSICFLATGDFAATAMESAGIAAQSGRGDGYNSPARRRFTHLTIDERVERIGQRLDLDKNQRLELKKLLEKQQTQADKLWNDPQLAPGDRRAKLQALQEDTQKRFYALLVGEQRKKYDNFVRRMLFNYSRPEPKSETKTINL
jgi:hypothetical protein